VFKLPPLGIKKGHITFKDEKALASRLARNGKRLPRAELVRVASL
jgi:hypothetical protein